MEIKPYLRQAFYYETDQMGVIHHSNYIRWFEEARLAFFNQILAGRDDDQRSRIGFGIASLSFEYRSMVRFEDNLRIEVTITKVTPTRMVNHCDVLDAATGELRASGEAVMFYYHFANQCPVNLKKEIPSIYKYFISLVDNISFSQ